jgi:peptidoglycan/LPS O-acetylase OafA/YrhL
MNAVSGKKHIPELDGIRGWACLSVLILHCLTGITSNDLPGMAFINTHTLWFFLGGVDLFFVLSGFLIGGILLDSKGKPHFFSSFWIRRIGRIIPVAYLVYATYAVALFIIAHFGITRFDTWLLQEPRAPLWTFPLFMQSLPIAFNGFDGPRWVAMSWSLAIEEQFYMLFPLAVYFLPRKRLVAVVIVGIVVAPILRDLFERYFGYWYGPYVLLPSRMDAILYGVAVALIVRSETAFALACRFRRYLDVFALLSLCVMLGNWRWPIWPGPSDIPPLKQSMLAAMFAIVILRVFTYQTSAFNRIWLNSLLAKIGLISYALYMYHQTVNGLVHGILFGGDPKITEWEHLLAAIAVLAISVGLATLSYIYFETPIRRYAATLAGTIASTRPLGEVARGAGGGE